MASSPTGIASTPTPTKARTPKEPVTLPTPERVTRTMYRVPSFSMTERAKGVAWIVTLEEMGWYCHCPYCKSHYSCKHCGRLTDWLFEQDILACLPEPEPEAQEAQTPAQKFMAQGGSIETLFDYGSQPSQQPARKSGRVKEEW